MYNTQRIKTELTRNGLTQKALAERASMRAETVSRLMLTGRAKIETVQKIARVLEVDFVELVKDE